jgi:hypothetical protein
LLIFHYFAFMYTISKTTSWNITSSICLSTHFCSFHVVLEFLKTSMITCLSITTKSFPYPSINCVLFVLLSIEKLHQLIMTWCFLTQTILPILPWRPIFFFQLPFSITWWFSLALGYTIALWVWKSTFLINPSKSTNLVC